MPTTRPSRPKTALRVRIAVVIDDAGNWSAAGESGMSDREATEAAANSGNIAGPHQQGYFVTVLIPLPKPAELAGVIEREAQLPVASSALPVS